MKKKRKLGIIGGSGLYKMDGFKKVQWKKINTPWGKPSDEILNVKLDNEEIYFIPRHSRGHKINPTNINFRANIDAMKQLGVTDIISVSAVGSLKDELEPGRFVIIDQFIDRTFFKKKKHFLMRKLLLMCQWLNQLVLVFQIVVKHRYKNLILISKVQAHML